jgi:hypothetical protein
MLETIAFTANAELLGADDTLAPGPLPELPFVLSRRHAQIMRPQFIFVNRHFPLDSIFFPWHTSDIGGRENQRGCSF